MESALMAAAFIDDALRGRRVTDGLERAYRLEFSRKFLWRYHAHHLAQRWAASPWMLNLLARRAGAGRFVQSELEALIAERGDATALFSWRGLLKALVR
jgi:hypothetical protein